MPKLNLKSRIIGHAEESPENLTANPLNFRRHPKEQIAALKGSMKELGWIKTVIVNKRSGYVLDGHARVEEAIRQGLPTIPVTYVDLDENEERLALAVLDPITELAYRDDETLKLLLEQANASDQDLKEFLQTLNNQEAESGLLPNADEDEVPEPPKTPITKLGDLILLGNHRLLCGDATKIEDVEKLMDGKKADMVFTDPPYGIDFEPPRGTHKKILNDDLNSKDFDNFLDSTFLALSTFMKSNTYAFIWTGWSRLGSFEKSIRKFFKIQSLHIWVKNNFGIGYYSRPKHEPFYLCLNGKPNYPDKAPADVWEADKVNKTIHSCEKPIILISNILNTYSKSGLVLDLFGGSGSTLIACEKTNRHCFMMELDPIYCDVIIERWEKATGKKAIRQ